MDWDIAGTKFFHPFDNSLQSPLSELQPNKALSLKRPLGQNNRLYFLMGSAHAAGAPTMAHARLVVSVSSEGAHRLYPLLTNENVFCIHAHLCLKRLSIFLTHTH